MTAINREAAISKTLTFEGGYCNNKADPGGPTNYGITLKDARLHWKPDATAADVKAMPKLVAIEIYRQKYWAKMGCDSRPSGPDFVDFDYGVNSGVGRVMTLRRRLDPLKLSPINYVKRACSARMSFLHALRTFSVFGKGWSRRVADVEATGVRMAVAAAGKPVAPSMEKRSANASTKATAHTTAATATASSPGILHHLAALDTSTKVGLCILGAVVVMAAIYFIWHAVHNTHRAAAYKDQIPCEITSPGSGPELNSNGTSLPSPSLQPSQDCSTGLESSTLSPSSSTSSPNPLPTS